MFCLHADIVFIRIIIFIINYIIILRFNTTGVVLPGDVSLELVGFSPWSCMWRYVLLYTKFVTRRHFSGLVWSEMAGPSYGLDQIGFG